MMEDFVFDCDQPLLPEPARFSEDTLFVEQLFKERHLKKQKTVLLIPYANSLDNLPVEFWETLTKQLNARGYTVCTNSSGNNELPIRGSCPVYIPYKELRPFLEMAGYSISFRCGLSDILSGIQHTKIVLYPKKEIYPVMGGISTVYDYFSLRKMGLSDDAIEYEINIGVTNPKDLRKIQNKILSNF